MTSTPPAYGTIRDGWGEECPDCGVLFPVLHGTHPTWVPCGVDLAVVQAPPPLSTAQRWALEAAANGDDTSWVRANTLASLRRLGLVRWLDNKNRPGGGSYITTPTGAALARGQRSLTDPTAK